MSRSTDSLEELDVTLTPKERAQAGEQLAALCQALEAAESAESARRSEVKKTLEALRTDILRQARAVHTGTVRRQVRCVEDRDFATGKARKVRTDTGELLGERDLSRDEIQDALDKRRQGGLFVTAEARQQLEDELNASLPPDTEVKVS